MKIAELPPLTEQPTAPESALPDRDALLSYLKAGRVIRAARSLAPDELDPERTPAVPLTVLTDGEWIWSGAVVYYAERYGVAVDPALVEHARLQEFQLGDVPDAVRLEALRALDDTSPQQGADCDVH